MKPIQLISGYSPFCETFLADVRVPVTNVVGQVNAGWTMAKALLGHERTMIADAFKERDDAKQLVDLARRHLGEDDGRIADPRAPRPRSRRSRWTRPASTSRSRARATA